MLFTGYQRRDGAVPVLVQAHAARWSAAANIGSGVLGVAFGNAAAAKPVRAARPLMTLMGLPIPRAGCRWRHDIASGTDGLTAFPSAPLLAGRFTPGAIIALSRGSCAGRHALRRHKLSVRVYRIRNMRASLAGRKRANANCEATGIFIDSRRPSSPPSLHAVLCQRTAALIRARIAAFPPPCLMSTDIYRRFQGPHGKMCQFAST